MLVPARTPSAGVSLRAPRWYGFFCKVCGFAWEGSFKCEDDARAHLANMLVCPSGSHAFLSCAAYDVSSTWLKGEET